VMMTGCEIEGRFLGRICVLSFRTHADHIDACVQHLTEESVSLIAQA